MYIYIYIYIYTYIRIYDKRILPQQGTTSHLTKLQHTDTHQDTPLVGSTPVRVSINKYHS